MSELGPVGAAYASCRARIGDLAASAPDAATITVPTCPAWTVHDIVAHVTGVVDDALNGRLDGVTTDPWTAAQVDARRGKPVSDVIEEWNGIAPAFESLLDGIGLPGRQAVFDLVSHEHDIRAALGRPGERSSDAVGIGVGFLARALVDSAPLPLTVRAAEGEVWNPADDPVATLTAPRFELLRALSGRRSESQLRAYDWDGDVDAAIPAFTFGPFSPAPQPIAE